MNTATYEALRLSIQVAGMATLVVLIPAVPLAYLFARRDFPGKKWLSSLLLLPLVLPPTAVGYLLLLLLADDGFLGREKLGFDLGLLFTWRGAVLAAATMAFPLVIRTVRVAFEAIDPRLEAMSRTLGLSAFETFRRVTLPLAVQGILAGSILGFSRALGEFGATIMLAGNIPGKTQTIAAAIFSAQQGGRPEDAQILLLFSAFTGLLAIWISERWASRSYGAAAKS